MDSVAHPRPFLSKVIVDRIHHGIPSNHKKWILRMLKMLGICLLRMMQAISSLQCRIACRIVSNGFMRPVILTILASFTDPYTFVFPFIAYCDGRGAYYGQISSNHCLIFTTFLHVHRVGIPPRDIPFIDLLMIGA